MPEVGGPLTVEPASPLAALAPVSCARMRLATDTEPSVGALAPVSSVMTWFRSAAAGAAPVATP